MIVFMFLMVLLAIPIDVRSATFKTIYHTSEDHIKESLTQILDDVAASC